MKSRRLYTRKHWTK